MNQWIIVGGGLSGLLGARLLREKNLAFQGLEATEQLGGRAGVGHHRLYLPENAKMLSDEWALPWEEVSEPPSVRSKGDWKNLGSDYSDEENFYLKQPFFSPKEPLSRALIPVLRGYEDAFLLRKEVLEIISETKTLKLIDGSEMPYENLLWCTSLDLLRKVWKGDSKPLVQMMKAKSEVPRGLNYEVRLQRPLFEKKNTVIFPFRFKEHHLRALGTMQKENEGEQTTFKLQWLLFLEEKLAEDHEEVAKCVRTLKRELEKEFPELKEIVITEKISYLPSVSGEKPYAATDLEVLPGVFYLGSQVELRGIHPDLRNMDLILCNYRELATRLS